MYYLFGSGEQFDQWRWLSETSNKLSVNLSKRTAKLIIVLFLLKSLKERFKLDDYNVMKLPVNSIIDFTSLKQIFEFEEFSDLFSEYPKPIQSFDMEGSKNKNNWKR